MLQQEDTQLCLVSRGFCDQWRLWSEPVQFMVEPREDGLIELIFRRMGEHARS